jgi:hypothetical protein
MSMNVFIVAEREIFFKLPNGSTGSDVQRLKFDAWQTRTEETNRILDSENPAEAYIAWVETRKDPKTVPVFADEDIFGEWEPVGFETVCEATEHINSFRDWMSTVEAAGFVVKFDMI